MGCAWVRRRGRTLRVGAVIIVVLAVIAGCGSDDAADPQSPDGEATDPTTRFQLQIKGDRGTAALPSASAAREICATVETGRFTVPPQVRRVELSVFGSRKKLRCRVPLASPIGP